MAAASPVACTKKRTRRGCWPAPTWALRLLWKVRLAIPAALQRPAVAERIKSLTEMFFATCPGRLPLANPTGSGGVQELISVLRRRSIGDPPIGLQQKPPSAHPDSLPSPIFPTPPRCVPTRSRPFPARRSSSACCAWRWRATRSGGSGAIGRAPLRPSGPGGGGVGPDAGPISAGTRIWPKRGSGLDQIWAKSSKVSTTRPSFGPMWAKTWLGVDQISATFGPSSAKVGTKLARTRPMLGVSGPKY